MGACIFGINRPRSKLNIKNKLIIVRIPNAIGEIILIALVNDPCKKKVKINPNKNIDKMTPKVIITPNSIICFLLSLFPT